MHRSLNFRRMQYTNIRTIILVQLYQVPTGKPGDWMRRDLLPSAFIVAGLGCGLSSRLPTGIADCRAGQR